jgi:hypothetical protein
MVAAMSFVTSIRLDIAAAEKPFSVANLSGYALAGLLKLIKGESRGKIKKYE